MTQTIDFQVDLQDRVSVSHPVMHPDVTIGLFPELDVYNFSRFLFFVLTA